VASSKIESHSGRNDARSYGFSYHSSPFSETLDFVKATPHVAHHVLMRIEKFSFGSICIDGVTYEHDVIIDRGDVLKRKKKPSKQFRTLFGHTPVSVEEKIPWKCERLVIGTGTGSMPVMQEVQDEAKRRKVELIVVPTAQAIEVLRKQENATNAILHVTC
jgi:hypothetical protein